MWRPLETFLYDWWPITSETRLLDRLARMPVRIVYNTEASSASDTWRTDWPALLRARRHAEQRAATMARHEDVDERNEDTPHVDTALATVDRRVAGSNPARRADEHDAIDVCIGLDAPRLRSVFTT